MNFGRLRFVAERAELGEGREALFSVEIPDTPGRSISFLASQFAHLLTSYLIILGLFFT